MKRRTRINYTPEQKAIIWDRYKQGDSLHDIARYVRQISTVHWVKLDGWSKLQAFYGELPFHCGDHDTVDAVRK